MYSREGDVSLSAGEIGNYATSSVFNLNAHQSYTTGYFRGKAKQVTGGSKEIVTARILSWDASFDHLLKDHTGAGEHEGTLTQVIYPD